MELTIAQIKDFSKNPEIYNAGLKFYEDGRVVSLEIEQNFDDKIILINATVQEDNGYFEVNLAITKDDFIIQAAHCNCLEHGISLSCKHVVAVLLKIFYKEQAENEQKQPIKVNIDPALLECIKSYEQNIVYSTIALNTNRKVHLEAIFELQKMNHSTIPALSFKVGYNKKYTLKNPGLFISDMRNNVVVRYGNECEFIHNTHSLDTQGQALYPLMEAIENDKAYFESMPDFIANNKFFYMKPNSMDSFFDFYKDKEINYHVDVNRLTNIKFNEMNPKCILTILKFDENNYECTFSMDNFDLILGKNHTYLFHEFELWRLSEEYSKQLTALLKLFQSKKSLLIPSKYMPTFYNNVLISVKEHLSILGDDISEFAPLPLLSKLYLDMPKPNMVTARLVFSYGLEEYNAFTPSKMSTYRNYSEEITTQLVLRRYMSSVDNTTGLAKIENSLDAFYDFFANGINECEKHCQIYATDKIKAIELKTAVRISMGVRLQNDLLEINFDTNDFPIDELNHVLQAYQMNKKYYRMKSGSFVTLEESSLSELSSVLSDLNVRAVDIEKGKVIVPKYRALPLDSKLSSIGLLNVERDLEYKTLVKAIKNIKDSDFSVPINQKNVLRNYQKVGYRWLKTMATYGFGGILADDMGIGKTLQVITLFEDEKINHPESTSLVICPSSLILNWESEIHKFSTDLKALVVSGSIEDRRLAIQNYADYDVLITSYDYLKRDIELYENILFKYQILDEAQYIKNTATKNAICVKEIKSQNKFALTGTPIENSLAELWSIFDFLMPNYLLSYTQFKKSYEIPIVRNHDEGMLESLKHLVDPFILRRIKKDVLKELPEKVENTMYIDMSEETKKLYLANVLNAKQELNEKFKDKKAQQNKLYILALLTKMRQLCCDPRLLYQDYPTIGDKLSACMELVHQCCESKKKVLIFSQFTSLLALVEKELKKDKISYYLLKGSTSKAERQAHVHAFNQDDTQVFLISLKAGGTGLNLTSAEVVIHFDPWWNISAQNQATDRAYRIGQHNNVQVFKLIMKDTIEEKIQNLQVLKKDLSDSIINENDGVITKMSKQDLMDLF